MEKLFASVTRVAQRGDLKSTARTKEKFLRNGARRKGFRSMLQHCFQTFFPFSYKTLNHGSQTWLEYQMELFWYRCSKDPNDSKTLVQETTISRKLADVGGII